MFCKLRAGGFAELPAIWAELGFRSGFLPSWIAEGASCGADPAGCFVLLDGSPRAAREYAKLALEKALPAQLAADASSHAGYSILVVTPGRGAEGPEGVMEEPAYQLLAFRREKGRETFLGHVEIDHHDTWHGMTFPDRLRIERAGDMAWLVLRHSSHCGTGCLYLPERWFTLRPAPVKAEKPAGDSDASTPEVAKSSLTEALQVTYQGHEVSFVPYLDREYEAAVVRTGTDGKGAFVDYAHRVTHKLYDADDAKREETLFVNAGTVRQRFNGKSFDVEPGPGKWSEADLKASRTWEPRAFLERNEASLSRFARGDAKKRALLRALLERQCGPESECGKSPAGRRLRALLR